MNPAMTQHQCHEADTYNYLQGLAVPGEWVPNELVSFRIVFENYDAAGIGTDHDIVLRTSREAEGRNGANASEALVRQDALHFAGLVRSQQFNHLEGMVQ